MLSTVRFNPTGGKHRHGRRVAPSNSRHLRHEMNGGELPVGFGGPLRLRVPRQLGYKSVKYITRLTVTDTRNCSARVWALRLPKTGTVPVTAATPGTPASKKDRRVSNQQIRTNKRGSVRPSGRQYRSRHRRTRADFPALIPNRTSDQVRARPALEMTCRLRLIAHWIILGVASRRRFVHNRSQGADA